MKVQTTIPKSLAAASLCCVTTLVSGAAFGDVFIPPPRPPFSFEKCLVIQKAVEELKWSYVDQKNYLSCKTDSDCTSSNFGSFCGTVVNKKAAADYGVYTSSVEYKALAKRDQELGCPHAVGMCMAPGTPACKENKCAYDRPHVHPH